MCGCGNQDFFIIHMGTALAGTCNKVDKIIHRSLMNVNLFGPELVASQYTGQSQQAFESVIAAGNVEPSIYTQFWDNVAAELGMTVLRIKQTVKPILATKP